MLTQAEQDKMHQDDIAEKLADTDILVDCEGPDYAEILEAAIVIATDSYDVDCIDGVFVDCTDYEESAKQALEQFVVKKEDEHFGRGDYLRDLKMDR